MAARRLGVIGLVLCLWLCMMPCCAQAFSTADAMGPISVQNECVLTMNYRSDGKSLSDVSVKLYHVAEVSADFQYTLLEPFADSGLALNGIQTNGEWNIVRSTLEALILSNNVEPDRSAATDRDGQVCFEKLQTGLYLVESGSVVQDGFTYSFDAALVALPGLDEDGMWQYQVTVTSKSQVIPPAEPDDEIQLKVLKLWKGDKWRNERPKSVEVEIFRNGVSENIVTLSDANNWTYIWTTENDGAVWKVVERNVPSGYSMTVEKRGTAFVLTNSRNDNTPPDSPQTGDTSHILLYTVLMYVSGILLIILGIVGKRKRNEKTR